MFTVQIKLQDPRTTQLGEGISTAEFLVYCNTRGEAHDALEKMLTLIGIEESEPFADRLKGRIK